MKLLLLPGVLLLFMQQLAAQTPFKKFEPIHYKHIAFNHGTALPDSTPVATADLGKLRSLNGIRIDVRGNRDDDSCTILIARAGKTLQRFTIAGSVFGISDSLYAADIDHDGRRDLKFVIQNNGSGLAAEMTTKVYLFNTVSGFVCVSFLDFAYEPEYDLDHDGVFEILGKDHIQYHSHSYWVYNLYRFKLGHLINVSRKYGYPFWTRHLYPSHDNIPATRISQKERMTAFKALPGEVF